jgi:hypothetical protein
VTRWEHRTVVVAIGDDGPVTDACDDGWEPYAAVPARMDGPGVYDTSRVAVLLRRVAGE